MLILFLCSASLWSCRSAQRASSDDIATALQQERRMLSEAGVSLETTRVPSEGTLRLAPESDTYSHFLHVTDGDSLRRIFGLGIYTPRVHPRHYTRYDPIHSRIIDDHVFSSLMESMNLVYTRYTRNRLLERPDYYDFASGDKTMIMGSGHLNWWLRNRYAPEGETWLRREQQENLRQITDPDGLKAEVDALYDLAGESNLIVKLIDEPEHGGAGDSWSYTADGLRMLYDAVDGRSLVALGLGPVGQANGSGRGNKLIWSLENPGDMNVPPVSELARTSLTWQEVLDISMNYYEGTYDILWLNSYALQNSEPSRTGAIVRNMLNHPTIAKTKPVWIWISAENFRFGDPDEAMDSIRRQTFSALANEVSGLLFYPDTRVRGNDDEHDERLWELTFDLIKEIQFWRPVLERGSYQDHVWGEGLEWIIYEYGGYEYLFAVNHTNQAVSSEALPGFRAAALESGIWARSVQDGEFRRMHFPSNLTFHEDVAQLTSERQFSTRRVESKWSSSMHPRRVSKAPVLDTFTELPQQPPRAGTFMLQTEPSEAGQTAIETRISVLPGMSIEGLIWYLAEYSEEEIAALTAVIYDENGRELRRDTQFSQISAKELGYNTDWTRLSIQTAAAPANAAWMTLKVEGRASMFWDDAVFRISTLPVAGQQLIE